MKCAECGYDLRGQSPESVCPECGRPVAETVAARPVTAWLPRYRRGVAAFVAALLLLPVAERLARVQSFRAGPWLVNSDGLIYLARAVLLLPALWWMTTPAPFLRPDPRRLRPWLAALAAVQFIAAALAIGLLHCRAFGCTLALLVTYGLTPLAFAAEMALLLALLARPLPLVPGALPRWVVLGMRWVLLYSLFAPAVFFAVVNAARIGYIDRAFSGATYIPEPWNTRLDGLLAWPALRVQRVAWLACVLVAVHCLFRLRRAVGLPPRNAASR